MTPAMARCLEAIKDLTVDGVSPSFRELKAYLNLSTSGVHRLVTALEERGHLTRIPNRARSFVVIEGDGLRHYSTESLHALQGRITRELWRRQQGWAA